MVTVWITFLVVLQRMRSSDNFTLPLRWVQYTVIVTTIDKEQHNIKRGWPPSGTKGSTWWIGVTGVATTNIWQKRVTGVATMNTWRIVGDRCGDYKHLTDRGDRCGTKVSTAWHEADLHVEHKERGAGCRVVPVERTRKQTPHGQVTGVATTNTWRIGVTGVEQR